jgi:hypothetical protein
VIGLGISLAATGLGISLAAAGRKDSRSSG